ncbi:MAG: D-alanyl-D-alanine carboxypeptidase/D-alanyl-D-alanine-endopeptidase, partial [Pseudomonadota bacterium]
MTRAAIFGLAVFAAPLALAADGPAGASGFADRVDTALAGRLLGALDSAKVPREAASLVVKRLGDAEPLVALNAQTPRNPASVTKMLTTFAALDTLGPGYRWRTEAFTNARPDDLGRVETLYVRGNGNPFWVTDEFNAFVRGLHSRGVQQITGELILDRSYYDLPPGDPGAFDDEPHRVYNVLPTPLTLNFNSLALLLVPNVAAHRLDVQVDPPVTTLGLDVDVLLKRRACERRNLDLSLNVNVDDTGYTRASLTGEFPNRCRAYEIVRALLDPTDQLVGAFESSFDALGGDWSGGYRDGVVPENAVAIFEQPSRTLGEIARSMNKFSNNVMARQIFLTLGAEAGEAPATLLKARAALHASLQNNGVSTTDLHVDNGAGLSRDTRVTARTLVELLEAAWAHRYGPEFFSAMPVPGVDGTLAVRFPEENLAGQAHVKTGTLDHVIGLAGLVQAGDGTRY